MHYILAESAYHYLVYKVGMWKFLIGWALGTFMTVIFGSLLVYPLTTKLRKRADHLFHLQTQQIEQQAMIANLLDTETEGGLAQVVEAVKTADGISEKDANRIATALMKAQMSAQQAGPGLPHHH